MTGTVGLSIVIPVYNGALTIGPVVRALGGLSVDDGLEIILVNDGSRDDSLTVCLSLAEHSPVPLTVVDLSRNFGEHNAVMAGLAQARGTFIVTMDDDQQNSPAAAVRLYDHARRNQLDLVYSRYPRRRHAVWRNLGSRFANWCADRVIDKPKGLYLSSFRCMSSFAANAVVASRGPCPHVDMLLLQATQRIDSVEVEHLSRPVGQSNYTFARLVRLWLSMMLGGTVLPLRLIALCGLVLALAGLILLASANLSGGLLLLAGVQMLALGIVAEYLGQLFRTVNGKPQYLVRSVTRSPLTDMRSGGAVPG
jgi:glycosyltransferase involved in cell wall biosynthesis